MIARLGDLTPTMAPSAWIAPGASVVGDVTIGENVGIWFNAVLRGDVEAIAIGDRTNIQDGTVCHTDPGSPLVVGEDVTVGHQVMLHGCTIGDRCLIGINSVVLNGVVLGDECLVGANALVTENQTFEPRSLIIGSPAKAVRQLTAEECLGLQQSADHYVANARRFSEELEIIG